MEKKQVRLSESVALAAIDSARNNGRTLPREVNFQLAVAYQLLSTANKIRRKK